MFSHKRQDNRPYFTIIDTSLKASKIGTLHSALEITVIETRMLRRNLNGTFKIIGGIESI